MQGWRSSVFPQVPCQCCSKCSRGCSLKACLNVEQKYYCKRLTTSFIFAVLDINFLTIPLAFILHLSLTCLCLVGKSGLLTAWRFNSFSIPGFNASEDCAALEQLLEGYDQQDQDQVYDVCNSPLFKYMDNDVSWCLSFISAGGQNNLDHKSIWDVCLMKVKKNIFSLL